MSKQIKIKNQDLLLSENLEEIIKEALPYVKVKSSHSINQLEIQNNQVTTHIDVDNENEILNINSMVAGGGITLWLFVIVALPFQLMFNYEILDVHWSIKILCFSLAFAIAGLPGQKKKKDWEVARRRIEREMEELLDSKNIQTNSSVKN